MQCGGRINNALPTEIRGVSLNASRSETEARLKEIGKLESEGRKTGQLWRLRDDAQFSHLVVGYDKENRVKFVTGIVDKKTAREAIKFSDVGDVQQARKEITPPHHKYIWEIPPHDGNEAYFVNVYGDNPEQVTIFSINKKPEQKEIEED